MFYNLSTHIKGEVWEGVKFFLQVTQRDGEILDTPEPINLTDVTITATFRYGSETGLVTNVYTIGDGINVINAEAGEFDLLKDAIVDWAVGYYYLDILFLFPNEQERSYITGVIQILPENTNTDECCNYSIIYCECPYAVLPCNKFILRQYYENQKISFYICAKTGNWGDQNIFDLTNYNITVNVYDTTGALYLSKEADWSPTTKKCSVNFDSFDLKDKGYYYVELDIQHKAEDLGWQVPDRHKRIDLEIK